MKFFFNYISITFLILVGIVSVPEASAQINTDQVMNIGRNALYFEDYILSIQYFNQVIKAKPYLAEAYFFRGVAKLSLEDYRGAEADCTLAIERNPFIVDAYQVRGIARQTLKKNKEAIEDYNKGLEQRPYHKTFLFNKAIAETEIKQFADADSTYTRLIGLYPDYDGAYLGYAQLHLSEGDTIKAIANIDKCLSINKNNTNAYLTRADINIKRKQYDNAISDLNEAIKLEPQKADLFVNRAIIKYNTEDYFGAMADFDYAIDVDPNNFQGHFNRGLLRAEVRDDNKAIEDFSFVLKNDPDNILARYNRAEIYQRLRQYKKAIADYNVVLNSVTDVAGIYFARSECKRLSGDIAGGERDYNKAKQMFKARPAKRKKTTSKSSSITNDTDEESEQQESEEEVMRRFKQLQSIEANTDVKPEYDNRSRGHIQNRNFNIDAEPQFVLSYYNVIGDIQTTSYYANEINAVNNTHLLPKLLLLTCHAPNLTEAEYDKRFASVEYFNGIIAQNPNRAIDYLARGLDLMMVRNYTAALADFDRAIALSPDFTLAYFARANAKFAIWEQEKGTPTSNDGKQNALQAQLQERKASQLLNEVSEDYLYVIKQSPDFIYAHYNRGCVLLLMQDYTSAISEFSKTLQLKPDLGEAYYNRGITYLQLGNRENGISDLSKAGEHGITPSYSVLKRMTK